MDVRSFKLDTLRHGDPDFRLNRRMKVFLIDERGDSVEAKIRRLHITTEPCNFGAQSSIAQVATTSDDLWLLLTDLGTFCDCRIFLFDTYENLVPWLWSDAMIEDAATALILLWHLNASDLRPDLLRTPMYFP